MRYNRFLEIMNLIPKEFDGELFYDALARIRCCVGGGSTTENAESGSDLEVVSDSIPVDIRCLVKFDVDPNTKKTVLSSMCRSLKGFKTQLIRLWIRLLRDQPELLKRECGCYLAFGYYDAARFIF